MIELIGLLLCVYLLVKGLELIAMQKASAGASVVAYIGAAIAIVAAILFFVFFIQPSRDSTLGSAPAGASTSDYSACLENAVSSADRENCERLGERIK
jgi:hypothetical protein